MKHPSIDKVYAQNTAYAPHKKTDALFMLENGDRHFSGMLQKALDFITQKQLMDAPLWKLFVHQFEMGNSDDHNVGWRCEYWGKMMRGACMVYQVTADDALFDLLTETVKDMLKTQDVYGRMSTYSKEKELDGWDLWGRKYILLGMMHFMEINKDDAFNQEILSALMKHADAIIDTVGCESEGKKEILKCTRHWNGLNSASILEPFMRLYNLTGEKRYLDFAGYIVSTGATEGENIFELAYVGKLAPYEFKVTKAYEMMSCFEGLLEYYRVTGIEKWKTACLNLAEKILETDVTVIGCSGCTHELFDHSAVRQFDIEEKGIMQETCVTVTWMKFLFQLLCLTGNTRYADQMEISFYNALLGAINTDEVKINGGLPFDSYAPLLPGLRGRQMGGYQVMENNTYYGCCACIGAAGLGLFGIASVMNHENGPRVHFFENAAHKTLTPQGNPLTLTISGDYVKSGRVKIHVDVKETEAFEISIRIPSWSENPFASVNGGKLVCTPGRETVIEKSWSAGDVIELDFGICVRAVFPEAYGVSNDEAPYIALKRGAIVLARDARLGMDVSSPVSPKILGDGSVCAKEGVSPYASEIALLIENEDGSFFPVTDYASAGKTWTEESRMCAWMIKN